MNETSARQVHCEKCRATLTIPEISPMLRTRVAALVRSEQKAEATRQLKISGGVELAHGKGIVLHITSVKNQCNRCRGPLAETEESVCGKCQAFNLNW